MCHYAFKKTGTMTAGKWYTGLPGSNRKEAIYDEKEQYKRKYPGMEMCVCVCVCVCMCCLEEVVRKQSCNRRHREKMSQVEPALLCYLEWGGSAGGTISRTSLGSSKSLSPQAAQIVLKNRLFLIFSSACTIRENNLEFQ